MRIVLAAFSLLMILVSADLCASGNPLFKGEGNSLILYRHLSEELAKDPAGKNSYLNIVKLVELSQEGGREKTADLFRRCVERIAAGGNAKPAQEFVLNYYAGLLVYGPVATDKAYGGFSKWRVSGPWHKYGTPDLYMPFAPETAKNFDDFMTAKTGEEGSVFFTFGHLPERMGTAYAAASFISAAPVRIWVASNSRYRLFINGVEAAGHGSSGEFSLSGIEAHGARGYTILVKISDNSNGDDPWFRVVLTDTENRIVKPEVSGERFRGAAVIEKIFSSESIKDRKGFHGSENMSSMIDSIKGDNARAFETADSFLKDYPLCGEIYHAVIPVLIKQNKRDEFLSLIDDYRKRFPGSDYFYRWEAEFYRDSDMDKFSEAMDKLHPIYCTQDLADAYMKFLADKKGISAAMRYSARTVDIPSLRPVKADIMKGDLSSDDWRKYLIGRIAETGDPLYYYLMGNADMDRGLDPILYWEKALSIRRNMRDAREAADIFENGGDKGSEFYSGRYSDMQPEFLWNGVKRNVTVRIFAGGYYMTECEEIVPKELAVKGEFKLLHLKDLRVLYVLGCSSGESLPLEYETSVSPEGFTSVKFSFDEKQGFAVIKYTGYSGPERLPFNIFSVMELKRDDEDVSEVNLKIISGGDTPAITFMDKKVHGERGDKPGEIEFNISGRFNFKDSEKAYTSASIVSSDREFAKWYSGLVKVVKNSGVHGEELPRFSGDIRSRISAVSKYISQNFRITGGNNFEPRFPEEVIRDREGTTGELAILSSVILEKSGVRGVIAFIRKKGENITPDSEAAIYIPESKGRGHWIRFTDGEKYKNAEALVIRGDGFEIIPVSDKGEDR